MQNRWQKKTIEEVKKEKRGVRVFKEKSDRRRRKGGVLNITREGGPGSRHEDSNRRGKLVFHIGKG